MFLKFWKITILSGIGYPKKLLLILEWHGQFGITPVLTIQDWQSGFHIVHQTHFGKQKLYNGVHTFWETKARISFTI